MKSLEENEEDKTSEKYDKMRQFWGELGEEAVPVVVGGLGFFGGDWLSMRLRGDFFSLL